MSQEELIQILPLFNASCNALSFFLLLCGWMAIRKGKVTLHASFMGSAFLVSILFLTGYLTRFFLTGPTHFQGQGFWRILYFSILISHSLLALINVPLVLTTLTLAIRKKIPKHRRWAKITLPIWLYVSLTGVLIYLMLYQWF